MARMRPYLDHGILELDNNTAESGDADCRECRVIVPLFFKYLGTLKVGLCLWCDTGVRSV
jgi:hypothetical protein